MRTLARQGGAAERQPVHQEEVPYGIARQAGALAPAIPVGSLWRIACMPPSQFGGIAGRREDVSHACQHAPQAIHSRASRVYSHFHGWIWLHSVGSFCAALAAPDGCRRRRRRSVGGWYIALACRRSMGEMKSAPEGRHRCWCCRRTGAGAAGVLQARGTCATYRAQSGTTGAYPAVDGAIILPHSACVQPASSHCCILDMPPTFAADWRITRALFAPAPAAHDAILP